MALGVLSTNVMEKEALESEGDGLLTLRLPDVATLAPPVRSRL